MIQNLVQGKCLEHCEEIIAIDENEKENQKRGLCAKCLVKRDKKEVKHIQDSINQIQQAKQLIKDNRSNQLQTNLENINKLNQNIEQLKNFYIQQIEQIIISIQKWTQSIVNIEENYIDKLLSIEANDYQMFLIYIQEEENNFKLNQSSFQKDINNLIKSLDKPDLISKCIEILKQTFAIETIFELELKDEQIQNINLLCEDHQEKIILFDLSQERTSSKRVACQYCLDSFSSLHYKSVKYVQNKWGEITQNRLENMQNHANLLKNKIKLISKYFDTLKKDFIKSLDNANKVLYNYYDEYSVKLDAIKKSMNQQWQDMSKDEVIKILLELSNLNNQSTYLDPLFSEYNYQDNQINEVVKDTVLCLQECQGSQLNKINELINNLLIVDQKKTKIKESTKVAECQSIIETTDQSLLKSITLQLNSKQIDLSIHLNQTKHLTIHTQLYSSIIQSNQSQSQQQLLKSFTYNLLQNYSVKQKEDCYVIAINTDNSIVLVGCKKQIKVFEFKQEQFNQTQLLSGHLDNVVTLNFMKKSSQFISGGSDKCIIIWCMDQNNQWICKYKLYGHKNRIRCLILNNNEDIIISGSEDQQIKFWMNSDEWNCSQTITEHINYVYGLSMNEQQNKLISCGKDKLILIIEYSSQNYKWNVIQKITVEQYGLRICFINDDVFTFQPYCEEKMYIYEMNNTNKQYSKTKDIIINYEYLSDMCLFPQQYIKQKSLIVNKNGYNLNLICNNQNGNFQLQQSLDFGTVQLYGAMSDNGDYLITWDDKQKEIQIRQYQKI